MNFKPLFLALALAPAAASFAAAPDGYYSSCENKTGAALLTALYNTVGSHTTVSYDGLYTVYKTSDITANGKIWDMYSTKEWPTDKERCGNYKNVGDCYNREHSMPQSWFNSKSPMVSDAFHVYPTDGKVNGQRSNYPYGECENGTTLASNNGIDALGRLGTCTFSGYTGKVFEPDDQYKGDFARTYFYMAAAYNDKISSWSQTAVFAGNSYPVFTTWTINLMLKWHRQDPVSQKELDRNDAVYAKQKNRNPFIDHPELAEYIWGEKVGTNWTLNASEEAMISVPSNGSTIDLGTAGVGVTRTKTIAVNGSGLKSDVTVTISGEGFSCSTKKLSASSVNATNGTSIDVSYLATAVGSATGTLTLTSGDATSTVNLTVKSLNGLPATEPSQITDCSFIAQWSYIGDEDSNGCYTLTVTDENGDDVDTYPRSVKAADEKALVDELESETTYYYTIKSASGITSNVIKVTTQAPIPSVQFLYDGELYFSTMPGVASDAEELLLDIDNIDTDITITVASPFELSTDKAEWKNTITISPEEDRIYMRINSDTEGTFTTSLAVKAGSYESESDVIEGNVSSSPTFVETFETETVSGTYITSGTYQGVASLWDLSNVGVFNIKNEAYEGTNYARFGNNSTSTLAMAEDRQNGIGTVTLAASCWSNADGDDHFVLEYSTDGGVNWTQSGTEIEMKAQTSQTKTYNTYTFTVNQSGKVRLRIRQTYGKRMCVDYITATDYRAVSVIDGVSSNYHEWDAYCRGGQLCVELGEPSHVAIHGIDGITRYNGTMSAGTNRLDLAPGLYIIVVDDFSRRVLVK